MKFPLRASTGYLLSGMLALIVGPNHLPAQSSSAAPAQWVSPRRVAAPVRPVAAAVEKPMEQASEPIVEPPYTARLTRPAPPVDSERPAAPVAMPVSSRSTRAVAAQPRPMRRPPVVPTGRRSTSTAGQHRHAAHRQTEWLNAEEVPADIQLEQGPVLNEHGHGCECEACVSHCGAECHVCDDWCWSQDLILFGGTQGFKSAPDRGQNGNFGFHEGINWGGPMWNRYGIGYQIGAQVTHSDLSGTQVNGVFDDDPRSQAFLSAGLFRRGDQFNRLQMGVVADWLRDEYLIDVNLTQVRAEMSYFLTPRNEVGFAGAFNAKADSGRVVTTQEEWAPVEQYNVFWRHRFSTTSEGRLMAGTTGEGDGLFGGETMVAISPRFALQGAFLYLNPGGGTTDAVSLESWGISMNMIWYPGQSGFRSIQSLYRPLFNVADNSTFLIGREQP